MKSVFAGQDDHRPRRGRGAKLSRARGIEHSLFAIECLISVGTSSNFCATRATVARARGRSTATRS